MSKKANPTLIGLFVILGLALGVVGLVLFGSGKWFRQTEKFIVYFDTSLKGLNPGSAVRVSGVKVGTVKDVLIRFNQEPSDVFLPVIIEIDDELLNSKMDRTFDLEDPKVLQEAVDNGLRAKLEAESLVTGMLYVDLSILPDPPPARYHQLKPLYSEIPSAPNDIQRLMENLAALDFRSLSEKLDSVLAMLERNLGELRMREISAGLTNLLTSLDEVVHAPQLTNSLAKLDRTLAETHQLVVELRTKVDPVADGAQQTLAETRKAATELRLAIEDLRGLMAPEGPLKRDMAEALEQISVVARSVSDLADYLSRNPNALLSGRKHREPNP